MAYSDRQNAVFSKLAYYDLDERISKYTSCGLKPPPVWELLTDKERTELTGSYNATEAELKTWRVVEVQENPKTQFSACIIETGNNEAAVGFRGSLGFSPESWEKTWIDADFKLLSDTETKQHGDCLNFLKSNSSTLNQYDNLTFAGHSLGGNLAVYSTIMAKECGIDTNKLKCVSLDGPGFNTEFINKYRDKIGDVSDKITQFRWSPVGSCLSDLPGVEVKYANYKNYEDYTGKEKWSNGLYNLVGKHDLDSVVFNEDGSISTTTRARSDEMTVKTLSFLLDNVLPDALAITVPYIVFGAGGYIAFGVLKALAPDLADKLFNAYRNVCHKIYNTFVSIGLTALGKIGNFLGGAINSIVSFFDGSYWRKKEEEKALARANESANANPYCYVNLIEYESIASDCKKIAKKINAISNKLKKSYKLPGVFNDSRPDIPVINQLLGAINATHNKCNEWLTKTGQAAAKCDSCYSRLNAISNYLNDTSTNFKQAESSATGVLDDWYNSNKEIKYL